MRFFCLPDNSKNCIQCIKGKLAKTKRKDQIAVQIFLILFKLFQFPSSTWVEDPANAALVTQFGGIPLIIQCLSSPVRNTVNYAVGALYYMCNASNKEEILRPEVIDVIERYAAASAVNVSFSNLAQAFLDKHVSQQQWTGASLRIKWLYSLVISHFVFTIFAFLLAWLKFPWVQVFFNIFYVNGLYITWTGLQLLGSDREL